MKVTVTTSYKSAYPDPIEFEKGDLLKLGRRDTEYPGWIWVLTACDVEGWAPEQYISATNSTEGVGKTEYNAKELNTEPGEELAVLKELNGWYWVENSKGERGWIPIETTI